MHVYRVAAHGRGAWRDQTAQRLSGDVPAGKLHAYMDGSKTTACGFALGSMQKFEALRFSDMTPSARCPLCARKVGADH
jgi:hypothetical protein